MTKQELLEHIKLAMKQKDKVTLSILRQINQSIKQIEVDERREITEADVTACIKKLQKVTKEELENLKKIATEAHQERVDSLASQLTTLEQLLPKQLSGCELHKLCDTVIAQVGAQTKRDTGKVMAELGVQTQGNFNKPEAAEYIGKQLA